MKNIIIIIIVFTLQFAYTQSITENIDAYVSSYVETGDFSGCVVIVQGDSIIYTNSFGMANRSFDIKNTKKTKFMIGSISKQFTAVGILKLEEKGLINTEDTLSKYFPEYSIASQITIEQLLTHTSGIGDIFNLPDFSTLSCKQVSLKQLSDLVLNQKLLFTPGTQYQYSNGGYAILAQIIEQVSQKSYADFMQQTIFKPLGMLATGHKKYNEVVNNLAVGYDPLGYDKSVITDFVDNELLKGSGSLYSNVIEMQKWITMFKDSGFLSESSYNKFFKNYGNNYGYGISVYKSFGKKVFGHDGRINGYIADYLHYIEDDISVIILGNIQTGVADFFRRDIAAILFNEEYQSGAKTIPAASQYPSYVEQALGSYSFGPNFIVYVEMIDGLVKAKANEGNYSELVPLSNGKFFSRTLYSFIDFVSGDDGKIKKMVWTNNDGNSFEGTKN